MATTKLNIGKIPISKGEYQEGTTYQRLNQVTMLGSTYQSKIDDNTSAPAQMGADGAVENINTDKWLCVAVGNVSAARKVVYNNETSGLKAGNVQEAIDETNIKVSGLSNGNSFSGFVVKSYYKYAVSNYNSGALTTPSTTRQSILVPVMPGELYLCQDLTPNEFFTNMVVVFYSELPTKENAESVKLSVALLAKGAIAPTNSAYMLVTVDPTKNGPNPRILVNKMVTTEKVVDNAITTEKVAILNHSNFCNYFIQPDTGKRNLYVNTNIFLNSYQLMSGGRLRFYDKELDKVWGTTMLIKVKPLTTYYASKINIVIEFDKNLNYIASTAVDKMYKAAFFTTKENTEYVSFNVYIGDKKDVQPQIVSLIETSEEIVDEKVNIDDIPSVHELFGVKRKFNAFIPDKSINTEKLSDDVIDLINKSKWKGKRLLVIGDSITAALKWQERVGSLLNMNVRTHAKGGIGILMMVDGDGSGTPPEGYDPDNFGVQTLYRLNTTDVTDVDIIILMGFYNERMTIKEKEIATDIYPTNNTFAGRLNYAIKRVYEELSNANNMQCKVVICSAHKYGKYSYSDLSSYDDGDKLYNATKLIADYNGLPCIDLMHNGNINKYNWNTFQSHNTPYSSDYIPKDGVNNGTNKPFANLEEAPDASANNGKYITIEGKANICYKSNGTIWEEFKKAAPWNADQLHLNAKGYYRLGDYIAGFINNL